MIFSKQMFTLGNNRSRLLKKMSTTNNHSSNVIPRVSTLVCSCTIGYNLD